MEAPIQKLKTPVSKLEIVIRDWITGEDSEYIEDALMSKVDVKPDNRGSAQFGKLDVATALVEQTHREIEKFIVSIGDQKENIVECAKKLPEDDYSFIQEAIKTRRKKKLKAMEPKQVT